MSGDPTRLLTRNIPRATLPDFTLPDVKPAPHGLSLFSKRRAFTDNSWLMGLRHSLNFLLWSIKIKIFKPSLPSSHPPNAA